MIGNARLAAVPEEIRSVSADATVATLPRLDLGGGGG
jgi:hypothetical protein